MFSQFIIFNNCGAGRLDLEAEISLTRRVGTFGPKETVHPAPAPLFSLSHGRGLDWRSVFDWFPARRPTPAGHEREN